MYEPIIAGGRTLTRTPKADRFGDSYLPEGTDHTIPFLSLDLSRSLIRYLNRNYGASAARSGYTLSKLVVTPKANEYGHKVFASVIYGADGMAGAIVAGKVEGQRIVWTTYMD